MKRIRFMLPLLAALAIITILAVQVLPVRSQAASPAAQPALSGRTISAWGHGEVALQPDRASIMLGVQSRARTAHTALATSNTKINAVLASLTKQGIPKQQIQTSDLSLWYDSEHNQYVATHNLGVRLDRVNRVGAVLDAAIGAGANNSFGVTFGLKNQAQARATALKAAIADARQRATTMARALSTTITQTISVDEATAGSVTKGSMAGGMGGGGGTPIQPGQYVISADVNVTYSCG